ncbi:MAG: hypothetical protein Q8L27_00865 [archaeon]|nr:hypothetical protein [archaeon]
MIEIAFKIAYTYILGLPVIAYLGAITFLLFLAAVITGRMALKNKISPITHETVVYFTIFVTLLYSILQLLLFL